MKPSEEKETFIKRLWHLLSNYRDHNCPLQSYDQKPIEHTYKLSFFSWAITHRGRPLFLPTFSIITISILLFSRDRSFSDTFVSGILLLMYCFWRIQIVALPLVTNCRVGKPSFLRFRYTFPSPCLIFLSLKSYFPRGFIFIDSRALWDLLDWHWYQPTLTVAICVSQLVNLLMYCFYLFRKLIACFYLCVYQPIENVYRRYLIPAATLVGFFKRTIKTTSHFCYKPIFTKPQTNLCCSMSSNEPSVRGPLLSTAC